MSRLWSQYNTTQPEYSKNLFSSDIFCREKGHLVALSGFSSPLYPDHMSSEEKCDEALQLQTKVAEDYTKFWNHA